MKYHVLVTNVNRDFVPNKDLLAKLLKVTGKVFKCSIIFSFRPALEFCCDMSGTIVPVERTTVDVSPSFVKEEEKHKKLKISFEEAVEINNKIQILLDDSHPRQNNFPALVTINHSGASYNFDGYQITEQDEWRGS